MRVVVRLKEKLKLELMLIRTRHRILLLLLTLPLLHSCCRRDKIRIEENTPIVLDISSVGSKALIDHKLPEVRMRQMIRECYDASGDRIETKGFGVYGYKMSGGIHYQLFDNIRVYPTAESITVPDQEDLANIDETTMAWTYTPTRYWDIIASYQFIAYWPYNSAQSGSGWYVTDKKPTGQETLNNTHKVITIHNVPNWQSVNGSEVDIMTAVKWGEYATYFSDRTAHMEFRHILSQVRIEAYSVGTSAPVYINSLTLNESSQGANDVLEGSGASTDFRQKYDESATPLEEPDEPVAGENYLDFTSSTTLPLLSDPNEPIQYVNEMEDNPTTVYTKLGHWLVVPHKWQNLVLNINRKIGDSGSFENREATITLGAANDYKILAGRKYVITLVFDTTNGGIKVASVAVKDWDDPEEENREVYNW